MEVAPRRRTYSDPCSLGPGLQRVHTASKQAQVSRSFLSMEEKDPRGRLPERVGAGAMHRQEESEEKAVRDFQHQKIRISRK